MLVKKHFIRNLIVHAMLLISVAACAPIETTLPTVNVHSSNTPEGNSVHTPSTTVTPVVETFTARTTTLDIRTALPLDETVTLTPTSTLESAYVSSTASILTSRTPLPGEIMSPDENCQAVPEPELVDIGSLPDDVYLAGVFNFCRGWPDPLQPRTSFDLDTGLVGSEDDPGVDVYFLLFSPTIPGSIDEYYLQPRHGARLFTTASSAPDIQECQAAISTDPSEIYSVTEGSSTCWITDEGRLAFVRVEKISPYGWASIALSFVTWKK